MTSIRQHKAQTTRRRAMTLIELILVMGLLSTIVALSMPSLSGFFRGRAIENEARRVLALIRYAQSEAASRSTPMRLWIRPETGLYGVSPQVGYELDDKKDWPEFTISEGLSFEINAEKLDANGQATILCQPDGMIDEESLESIFIRESVDKGITIARANSNLGYEIVDTSNDER